MLFEVFKVIYRVSPRAEHPLKVTRCEAKDLQYSIPEKRGIFPRLSGIDIFSNVVKLMKRGIKLSRVQ